MTSSPEKGLSWAVNQFDIESIVDFDLPKHHSLSQHDTFKIGRILENLGNYLSKLSECAKGIFDCNTNLDWYFDNRKIIFQLIAFLKKIDAYLSLIFELEPSIQGIYTLKEIASLSMDSMQLVTSIKKRSDVATTYMELRHSIIDTLDIELSECSTEMFSIKNTLKPPYLSEKLTIEQILEKFRFDGVRNISSPQLGAASLYSLHDGEEVTFDRLDQLEKRLDPMQASIEFLGHKISEFDSHNASVFPDANDLLGSDFRNLQNRWDALLVNFAALKRNSIDSRYYKIFYFVITEISDRVHGLIREVKNDGIVAVSENIAGDFKVCASTINFINLAFKNSLIYQKDLLSLYNESVLPRWSYLNVLLGEEKASPVSPMSPTALPKSRITSRTSFPSAGIDEVMSNLSLEPRDESSKVSNNRVTSGGSLNLGLGISPATTVPCSVVKKDRIIDLNIDAQEIPKSNIQMAIMGLSETSGIEQKCHIKIGEGLTVSKKPSKTKPVPKNVLRESSVPNFSPVQRMSRKSSVYSPSTDLPLISETVARPKKTTRQIMKMLKENCPPSSRIPTVSQPSEVPRIKKMKGKTHIPSISPENPVFYSPERRAELKTPHRNLSSSSWCDLPSVTEDTPEEFQATEDFSLIQTPEDRKLLSPWIDKRQLSGDMFFKTPPSKPVSRQPSLNSMQIPHLSPSDQGNLFLSPKWRSTSPERPGTSMGCRYDDANLTQPLKVSKQRWK